MRGGTAYCTVVISDIRIGSPIISNPRCACVFNRPSFDKFTPLIKPGGLVIINSTLINVTTDRQDIDQVLVPANDIATKAGNPKAANMVILGAFIGATNIVSFDTVKKVIKVKMARKESLLEANYKVLEEGRQLALDQLGKKVKA
jgi:2-oxoglutarate ferredoxin oxidoreductase subunit gamma